jgi:hypothetical protein
MKRVFADLFEYEERQRKALDDLTSRALAYRTGPELKQLFAFIKRFPHLAPYNAMLLHVQNPGIQFALRAPMWEFKYARRVNPGSRAYVILQTMGPVAFMFDLTDTSPINPKIDLIPEIVTNPFPAKGQLPSGALHALINGCRKFSIAVHERDGAANLAGNVVGIGEAAFQIGLNSKHTEAQRFGSLVHELAHIFCGHLGVREQGFWPDRRNQMPEVEEFEAEAVAYLVTDRLNLDIGSVQYLAGYLSDDKPLPNYSLDAVLSAVGKVEAIFQGKFRPRKPFERAKS